MKPVRIGLIGCGNISGAYLAAARSFAILDVAAVADLRMETAEARGREFGVPAVTVESLLADPSIEIVVNLTLPQAHVEVGLQAVAAGKHVHSEKPLSVTTADARRLIDAAAARGVRVGCAPDTFLGGAHQTARKLLDEGAIGEPVGGTAYFMCAGHERWHPNPAFYYAVGGGPMLDMGPYYVTDLVNLLGPVARVAGSTRMTRTTRPILSEPQKGQTITVEVPTHVAGTLEFESGALVTMVMSFDVPIHRHVPLEIYGTTASMIVPDPNNFGGTVEIGRDKQGWDQMPLQHGYADGNYRSIGVADMAMALRTGRPHRASGELAFHVLEVMEAFQTSSDEGRHVTITSTCERPAMLPVGLAKGALD